MNKQSTPPPNPFFIGTSPRSGSHFLTSLLNSTKKLGHVTEYLYGIKEPITVPTILDHFKDCYEKSRELSTYGELWGMSVHLGQLKYAERWLELRQVHPSSVRWIWLRRRDKMRQAISFIKACRTNIWLLNKNDPQEKKEQQSAEIEININDLYETITRFYIQDDAWSNFFSKHEITPHTIYYEDLIDESGWEMMISGVLDFLKITYQLPLNISTPLLKQSTGKTPKAYQDIIDRIKGSQLPLKYMNFDIMD